MCVLILKSTTAHGLHVGDARILRLRGGKLVQLTEDHRIWVSRDKGYLGRALGLSTSLEVDYLTRRLSPGDVFVLSTDGVSEHVDAAAMRRAEARRIGKCGVIKSQYRWSTEN